VTDGHDRDATSSTGAPGETAEFWASLRQRLAAPDGPVPVPAFPPDGGAAAATGRIGTVLGMALVGWVQGLPEGDDAVRRSRLYNRYRLAGGWRWAVRLRAAGIETVCLKGLGSAAMIYPQPELRTMADADLLVLPADLGRALRFLRQKGFVFGQEPTRSPWGYIGDASAEPLVSPEGVNLDLHQHPDSWPLHLGLPTEAVFADSLARTTPEGIVRVPRAEHQILIAASHAARDLFDAPSLKLLLDGAFLLHARTDRGPDREPALDWPELSRRARHGDSLRALQAYLTLLAELGLTPGKLPAGLLLPPGGAARRLLQQIAADMLAGRFADLGEEIGQRQKVMRELLLAASPRTVLWRNLRRLAGLLRPNKGVLNDAR